MGEVKPPPAAALWEQHVCSGGLCRALCCPVYVPCVLFNPQLATVVLGKLLFGLVGLILRATPRLGPR